MNNKDYETDSILNYLCHELSGSRSSSTNSAAAAATLQRRETDIRRHALEQLIEVNFGADVSVAAAEAVAAKRGDNDDNFGMVVKNLMDSKEFFLMRDAIRKNTTACSVEQEILSSTPPATASAGGGGNDTSCKKVRNLSGDARATTISSPLAPPTSFSLFAMLDSQGSSSGGSSLMFPPRIMASQIIDTYRQENCKALSSSTLRKDGNSAADESTLDLFEKAEDVEDLSPDAESWEEIRTILFTGLSSKAKEGSSMEAVRYLRVHEKLFEKCRGNDALKIQLWGIAQNLVGSILAHFIQFADESSSITIPKQTLDYCWDTLRSLLSILSQIAVDYVTSSVGNEWEIERMLLGLCTMLSNDLAACILSMMEPMAGFFEVWSRFVDPSRFIAIVHASGLGGMLLRRCACKGKSTASDFIWKQIQSLNTTSLDDIEHCNYVQSLSILRAILFRCDGSPQIIATLIHRQFIINSESPRMPSLFLSTQGISSSRDVQTLITKAEDRWKLQWTQVNKCAPGDDEMQTVLKPFREVLQLYELNPGLVDSDLHLLCSQTLDSLRAGNANIK